MGFFSREQNSLSSPSLDTIQSRQSQEDRRKEMLRGAADLSTRDRMMSALRRRGLESRQLRVETSSGAVEVGDRIDSKTPDFIRTFESEKENQFANETIVRNASEAAKLLDQLNVDRGALLKGGSREQIQKLKDAQRALESSGKTRSQLEDEVNAALDSKLDLLDRKSRGAEVSATAVARYDAWKKQEVITTSLHERLKQQMEANMAAFLNEGTDDVIMAAKVDALTQMSDLADAAMASAELSLNTLKSLAREVRGVVSTTGRRLEDDIQAYAEREVDQQLGNELELTPEDELLTSENIKRVVDDVVAESGINVDYDGGKHFNSLLNKLGVIVEDDGRGGQSYDVKANSPIRSLALLRDAVVATRETLKSDSEQTDVDYTIAAYEKATDLVQLEGDLIIAEAFITDAGNEARAAQLADIKKAKNQLEAAQKAQELEVNGLTEKSSGLADKKNFVNKFVRNVQAWMLIRSRQTRDQANERRKQMDTRAEQIAGLNALLET